MSNQEHDPLSSSPLKNGLSHFRKLAEKKCDQIAAGTDADGQSLTQTEMQIILHELQVHQIELEMQNEELRKAQDELNRSRTHFFDLYDLAPVGYVTVNDKGMILQANLTSAKLLKCERRDLINIPFSQFVYREDQDHFYLLLKSLLLRKESSSCDLRMMPRDGSAFWVHLSALVGMGENDDVVFHVAITDISARKSVEQELWDSEKRWKFAIEGAGDGLWDWDIPSNTVFFSKRWKEMLGYREDEIGNSFREWDSRIHPDDRERIHQEVQDHFEGRNAVYQIEHRVGCKDGSWKWILARGVIITRDKFGKPVRMIGTHTDISPRKIVEAELQLATDMLEEAQAVNRMGNWSYDKSTKKSLWSKQMFSLLGFPMSDIEPDYETTMACFVPEDSRKLDEAIRRALEEGTPYSLTLMMQDKLSDIKYVRCEGRARRDSSKVIIGLYGTVTDVTQEVKRENALQLAINQADAANRAKSEFLANMSHEIRTPLTAILGFAEVLREDCNITAPPQQLLHNINTITSAGQHLLTIINDILDLSKIEADKVVIELIETSLSTLLIEVSGLLQPKASGKGLFLDVRFTSPVPNSIMSDPTRFRQILMNLLGNAVKFTEAGGITLNIATSSSQGSEQLVVDVEDTGLGISEIQSKQLFQAFRQADSTVTRRHGGTGLGLIISQRLAKLMGGEVSLLWTRAGKGSCFRLVLPLIAVPGSILVDRLELQIPDQSLETQKSISLDGRILLVEDGIDNQRLISFLLKRAGASVVIAEDGMIALNLIRQSCEDKKPFNLVVTDMQMPVMDGYVLAKTLREQKYGIPIVALTAHALSEDREKCIDAGCDDYVSKPIDKNILISVCSKWLGASKRIQRDQDSCG